MTSPDLAISINELAKDFPTENGVVHAVRGLSLDVRAGEMFGIVGPDGAGKTTTIRLLCGILLPTSGSGTILGFDLQKEIEEIKREIGYLSQRFSLYPDLTIDENIEFFAEIHEVKNYKVRRDELLEFTRLTPFRKRLADKLSGGMKQKLALACTLIHEPKIIYLDEPTTGVDPVSRRDFWKILSSLLRQKITIVMATPYLDEAERCSRVALINNGLLLEVDTPQKIKDRMKGSVVEIVLPEVRKAYTLLKSTPEFSSVQAFGDRLNIVLQDPNTELPQLRNVLAAAGFESSQERIIPTSLENVFISLMTETSEAEA
jgi:ABC-2 type transport system ATP-binding protein